MGLNRKNLVPVIIAAVLLIFVSVVSFRKEAEPSLTSAQQEEIETIVNNYQTWSKQFDSYPIHYPNRIAVAEYAGETYFYAGYTMKLNNKVMATGGNVLGYSATEYRTYKLAPSFQQCKKNPLSSTILGSSGVSLSASSGDTDGIRQDVKKAYLLYLKSKKGN